MHQFAFCRKNCTFHTSPCPAQPQVALIHVWHKSLSGADAGDSLIYAGFVSRLPYCIDYAVSNVGYFDT